MEKKISAKIRNSQNKIIFEFESREKIDEISLNRLQKLTNETLTKFIEAEGGNDVESAYFDDTAEDEEECAVKVKKPKKA